jgi:hypothetical protein
MVLPRAIEGFAKDVLHAGREMRFNGQWQVCIRNIGHGEFFHSGRIAMPDTKKRRRERRRPAIFSQYFPTVIAP